MPAIRCPTRFRNIPKDDAHGRIEAWIPHRAIQGAIAESRARRTGRIHRRLLPEPRPDRLR
jgi:hypothetical protein